MKKLVLSGPLAKQAAIRCVNDAPEGYVLTLSEPRRSLEANSLMWVLLTAFEEQLKWPVNGVLTKMEAEDWKAVLSAAFHQESVRLAQGLNGGVVMLGQRTSQFSKKRMGEFIDFLYAVGADRGVVFDERMEAA